MVKTQTTIERVVSDGVVNTSRRVRGSIIFSGEYDGVTDDKGRVNIRGENVQLVSGERRYILHGGEYSLRLLLLKTDDGFRVGSDQEVSRKTDKLRELNDGLPENRDKKRLLGSSYRDAILEYYKGSYRFNLRAPYRKREFSFFGRGSSFEIHIKHPERN
jgi:hypothetical protein